jgi:hypothetical protein
MEFHENVRLAGFMKKRTVTTQARLLTQAMGSTVGYGMGQGY